MPGPLRAIATYALWATPLAVLVFLIAARFFAAWDGHAVSVWPGEEGARSYRVLVVEEDGTRVLRWETPLVQELDLPVDASGVPPMRIPDTAPHTTKSRFSLHFLVQGADGAHRIVPTTSPVALTLAVFSLFVAFLIRNMVVSGSPFDLTPRPTTLPAPLPPAGQVAQPTAARPKKGPPPPRSKRRRR